MLLQFRAVRESVVAVSGTKHTVAMPPRVLGDVGLLYGVRIVQEWHRFCRAGCGSSRPLGQPTDWAGPSYLS